MKLSLNLGLKPKTSEVILLDLLEEEILNYKEFKTLFKELAMIKSLKPNIISYFKKKAKNISYEKNNESKGGV